MIYTRNVTFFNGLPRIDMRGSLAEYPPASSPVKLNLASKLAELSLLFLYYVFLVLSHKKRDFFTRVAAR